MPATKGGRCICASLQLKEGRAYMCCVSLYSRTLNLCRPGCERVGQLGSCQPVGGFTQPFERVHLGLPQLAPRTPGVEKARVHQPACALLVHQLKTVSLILLERRLVGLGLGG